MGDLSSAELLPFLPFGFLLVWPLVLLVQGVRALRAGDLHRAGYLASVAAPVAWVIMLLEAPVILYVVLAGALERPEARLLAYGPAVWLGAHGLRRAVPAFHLR